MELWSPQITEMIQRMLEEQTNQSEWRYVTAKQLGAVFVFWDLYSAWFLGPTGDVIIVSEESDGFEVHSDQSHQLIALVALAKRRPELKPFLPSRDENAIECRCATEAIFASRLICGTCGGLGWYPASPAEI